MIVVGWEKGISVKEAVASVGWIMNLLLLVFVFSIRKNSN